MKKESIFFALCALVLTLILAPNAQTESPPTLKNKEDKVREEMLQLTKELGTTCTECHSVNNFKDDSKNSFKIGLKHMKLVAVMKAQGGFDGEKNSGPEANCFMCHRGQLKPPAKMH